jgi:putative MATE family efflux protein
LYDHTLRATLFGMSRTENITSGPITKTIFSLAVPPVLGMLMVSALGLTDFFWVGKLGATAQDAVTSAMVVLWTIYSLINIISVGITALVSRYVGAKKLGKVRYYIRQAFWLAVLLGAVLTTSGYFLTPEILRFMGTSPETLALAVPYLRVFFVASILFTFEETAYAIFRASGDTKTPMIVSSLAVLVNMVLDPVLIFGIGPFPELGVVGASVGTAIAMLLAVLAINILLWRGKLGYTIPKLFRIKPHLRGMFKIALIGIPIASQQLVFVIVYWFLIRVVHEFGESAGAAMGIGNRMESLSYLTCYGFSLAASTMVGQNLGARKPSRAARCAWGATGLAGALTLVIGALFVLIPEPIAAIFTSDPEVHKIAVDYLFILGLSQTAMAVEIVLEASFAGAGDTIPPMLVMIPGSLARIPLAYYLALDLGWGINGVWWTLTFTAAAKAAMLAFWFSLGRWKTRKL